MDDLPRRASSVHETMLMDRILGLFTLVLVCALLSLQFARAQEKMVDPIRWRLSTDVPSASVKGGDKFNAQLVVTIDEGWHLYAPEQSSGGPLPTRIKVVEGEPFKLAGEIDAPQPQVTFDPVFKMETQIFEGEVTFTLPIAVAADAAAGKHTLSVSATFQSCNKTNCLPPKIVRVSCAIIVVTTPAIISEESKPKSTEGNLTIGRPVQAGLSVGSRVPDFWFTDFGGKAHKFSEFQNKYVLLDFWATWCKPCLADIPHLKKLFTKYHQQGFEIIGMDSETLGQEEGDSDPQFAKDRDARARQIVSTRGARWTHATSGTAVPVAEKIFGVKTLPTKILIDSHGRIVARVKDIAELDQMLARTLGGKQ